MNITYEEASKEMEQLKKEWIDLQQFIEDNYIRPKEMLKIPNKIGEIIKKENALSARIKEAYPEDTHEKIALRNQYKEVVAEFEKASKKATEVEKRLLGMASPDQKQQIEQIKSKVTGNAVMQPVPTPKKTRLIVETTNTATPKTHMVLKKTMMPAFQGANEYKKGEITVTLEEE